MPSPLTGSVSSIVLSPTSTTVPDSPPPRLPNPVTFLAPVRIAPREAPVDSSPGVPSPPDLRRQGSASMAGSVRRHVSRTPTWISSLARASSRIVRRPKKESSEVQTTDVFSFQDNSQGTAIAGNTRITERAMEHNIASESLNSVDTDIRRPSEWTTSRGQWRNFSNPFQVEGTSRDLERHAQAGSWSVWGKKAKNSQQDLKRPKRPWSQVKLGRVGTLLSRNPVSRTLSRGKRWLESITQEPETDITDFERSFEDFIRAEADRPSSTVNIISGAESDIISIPPSQFSSDEEPSAQPDTGTHPRNVQVIMRGLAFDAAVEEDLLSDSEFSEDANSSEFQDVPSSRPGSIRFDTMVEIQDTEISYASEETSELGVIDELDESEWIDDFAEMQENEARATGFAAIGRGRSDSTSLYAVSQVGLFSRRDSAESQTEVASHESDDVWDWEFSEQGARPFPENERPRPYADFVTVYSAASAGTAPVLSSALSHTHPTGDITSPIELFTSGQANSGTAKTSLGERFGFTHRSDGEMPTEHNVVAIAVEHGLVQDGEDDGIEWQSSVVGVPENGVFSGSNMPGDDSDRDSLLERIREHGLFEHLDDIDDLVEKYRQNLFEHSRWDSTEIVLRQVEAFIGDSDSSSEEDTESDGEPCPVPTLQDVPNCTTAEELAALTLNNITVVATFSEHYDLETELTSLGDYSEASIDLFREEALFRHIVGAYRRVFFNLIINMVIPSGIKIQDTISEIMRYRQLSWDVLVEVAGLNRKISEFRSQVDQYSKDDFVRMPYRINACEFALRLVERKHKRISGEISAFEFNSHFDIFMIAQSIKKINKTRDRVLERYNSFHKLNDSHAGFGSRAIHRVTHMLEYKRMTGWHHELDTHAFGELLQGDIRALSMVIGSIEDMFLQVHENIAGFRNVISLYRSL